MSGGASVRLEEATGTDFGATGAGLEATSGGLEATGADLEETAEGISFTEPDADEDANGGYEGVLRPVEDRSRGWSPDLLSCPSWS